MLRRPNTPEPTTQLFPLSPLVFLPQVFSPTKRSVEIQPDLFTFSTPALHFFVASPPATFCQKRKSFSSLPVKSSLMGQVQSDVAEGNQSVKAAPEASPSPSPPPPPSPPPASMEALIAEATANIDDENESLDVKAQKALECPCVADLRQGPCGTQFSEAFVCFIKSTAEEKGSDCVNPFIALQDCIKANPYAFGKDVLEEDESAKEDEQVEEYKIIAPSWSREPKSKI